MIKSSETLFARTIKTLRQTPRGMVALGFGMGFLAATFETAHVVWRSNSDTAYLSGSCVVFISWVIVEYAITMAMADRRRSIKGLALYLVTNLIRFSPVLAALLEIFLFPKTLRQGFSTAILLVFVLIGGLLVVMLPAWPIEQSQSSKFISPWRALKATKEHRFHLFVLAGLASGMDRFVPKLTAINDPAQIALSVTENTLVNGVSNLVTAAIAASAFMFAIKNDPTLLGKRSADDLDV